MTARTLNLVNTCITNPGDMATLTTLCDMIRQGSARDVFDAIKIPFKQGPPPISIRAIELLDVCLDNTGMAGVSLVASDAWMDRIVKLTKNSDSRELKTATHRIVAKWASTFGYRPFAVTAEKLKQYVPPPELVRGPNGMMHTSNSGSTAPPPQPQLFPGQDFIMKLHEDVSNFEIALQRGSMTPDLVHRLLQHKEHLHSILTKSQNLPDHVRFSFINEQRTLDELLSLHKALNGDPDPHPAGKKPSSPRPRPGSPKKGVPSQQQDKQPPPPAEAVALSSPVEVAAPKLDANGAIDVSHYMSFPKVVELTNTIRALREAISHEKTENKNAMERIESCEAELAGLDAVPATPVIITETVSSAPSLVPRAKTLLASARAMKVEINSLKSRWVELSAQQMALCDRLNEALTTFPQTAERERKKDAKAVQRLQELYANEVKLRKQYYNTIQELKGNVRVFARVISGSDSVVTCPTDDEIVVMENGAPRTFELDAVFTPDDDQDDVFQDIKPFVGNALDGVNVCIVAYGATGSGKSSTLFGSDGDIGIVHRTLIRLFEAIEERKNTDTVQVEIGAVEFLNEVFSDRAGRGGGDLELKLGGSGTSDGTTLVGQSLATVSTSDEATSFVNSLRARSTNPASTAIIHCVLRSVNKQTKLSTTSKISLLDLPGSEGRSSGKTLTAFHDVFTALANGSNPPFKGSKLMLYLQEYMVGQSKLVILACVQPGREYVTESTATLGFVSKARGVSFATRPVATKKK
eukprot:PhF_6_TR36526/c0_g1_i3/m.53823/K10406/KIFC2_3; kinesin family member C2/C3